MKSPAKKKRFFALAFKRLFFFAALLIIVGFGSLSFLGENGFKDLWKLKALYSSLQQENEGLLHQQEELRAEVERLNDPRYLEYLARERLGLMRPHEVFLILDPPQAKSPVDKPL